MVQSYGYITQDNPINRVIHMSAISYFEQYIEKMLDWETSYRKEQRSQPYKEDDAVKSDIDKEFHQKLKEIIQSHIFRGEENELSKAKLSTMAVSYPPVYDQVVVDVSQKGKSTEIVTKRNSGLEEFYKFILREDENGNWMIESKYSSGDRLKWSKNKSL